jgi:hypothetical protein
MRIWDDKQAAHRVVLCGGFSGDVPLSVEIRGTDAAV